MPPRRRLEPELKVFLAGRVAFERDGRAVDDGRFPGRQGRLLFAYLAAEEGRSVPREQLAEALWGETVPATWDKALDASRALREVEAGTADYALDGLPRDAGATLEARYGAGSRAAREGDQRYFVSTANGMRLLHMNTSRPLFSSAGSAAR
jgi:hypothetical protein